MYLTRKLYDVALHIYTNIAGKCMALNKGSANRATEPE